MNAFRLQSKSDIIGSGASLLCLIHCILTPFLFVAQAELSGHGEAHPIWWGLLDVVFLVISYFAVWWSGKNTSKSWIHYALWASWIVLAVIVMNEKLEVVHLPEAVIYLPAISLIVLHLYNRKYCNHCVEE